MEKIQWGKWASVAVCLAAGVVGASLIFQYVLPILLPFIIAFCVSLLIRPVAMRLAHRTGLSQKVCAALLLSLFLIGVSWVFGIAARRLLLELQDLLARLLAEEGDVSELVQNSVDFFDTVTSKIEFLRRIGAGERFAAMRERFNAWAGELLSELLASLTAGIPALLGRFFAVLPTIFLSGMVSVIAAFYFAVDGERIGNDLVGLLPHAVQARLSHWRARARQTSFRYLRAYCLIWLLTFCELFLGFAILRVKYAFLLALVVSFVDLLPVLGVGTVLIPWSIVLLIQHRYAMAIGLLILYLTVTIVRQIAEPKLVGKSLGLSPMLTLFSTYAGWQLLGIVGMLLAPFVAVLVKAVWGQRGKQGKENGGR